MIKCTECGRPLYEPEHDDFCELYCELAAATARAEAAEAKESSLRAAGDALCKAAIRCGLHTWTNIPAEAAPRAVEFGVRMFEYFNASPTCEWPMDDTSVKNAKSPLLSPPQKKPTDDGGNYGGATHCFANDLIRELEREGGGKS